jgi:peroxiredoxin
MKHKGLILMAIVAVCAAALFLMPETKSYREIASVGQPAPDFEYLDSEGKLWKLSELKGKVVFINFWATWCVTCKGEMPHKEALYEMMKDEPFQMLGLLFRDDPANLAEYYKTQKVSLPTLISPDNESAKMFGITGVPETFIIDKEGIVREKIVGPREWDDDESVAIIKKWL